MRAWDVLFLYSLREYSNICTALSLRWEMLCLTSLCKLTWMSSFSHFTAVVINGLSEPVRYWHSYKSFLLLLLLLVIHAPSCYAIHMQIFKLLRIGFCMYNQIGMSPNSQRLAISCAWHLDLRKLFFSGNFPKPNSRSLQHVSWLLVLCLCLSVQGTDVPSRGHSLGFLPGKAHWVMPPSPSGKTGKQQGHIPTARSWTDLQPLLQMQCKHLYLPNGSPEVTPNKK